MNINQSRNSLNRLLVGPWTGYVVSIQSHTLPWLAPRAIPVDAVECTEPLPMVPSATPVKGSEVILMVSRSLRISNVEDPLIVSISLHLFLPWTPCVAAHSWRPHTGKGMFALWTHLSGDENQEIDPWCWNESFDNMLSWLVCWLLPFPAKFWLWGRCEGVSKVDSPLAVPFRNARSWE